jgi:hypothetical protein
LVVFLLTHTGASGHLLKNFAILLAACCLLGCASSETRSVVSKDDIPVSKYKKVALFIENLDEADRSAAEKTVVSTLQNAGVNAVSGSDVFKGRGELSEKAKASIVQKQFDAVLYLTVEQRGIIEELIPNAFFDGQMIQYNLGILTVGHDMTDLHVIRSDGSVYEQKLTLKTKVDLQDTKSAKTVWISETISSGSTKTTNMATLFNQAANQIVAKMREDSTI